MRDFMVCMWKAWTKSLAPHCSISTLDEPSRGTYRTSGIPENTLKNERCV